MPKQHLNVLSYVYIVEFIRRMNEREYYPKVAEIRDYLAKKLDADLSNRTVQRYLKILKDEFFIPLQKLKHTGGYRFDPAKMDDETVALLKNLQIMAQAEYFRQILRQSPDFVRYFSFSHTHFKGLGIMDQLIRAIHERRTVRIAHKKFIDKQSKIRTVEPYFLKEHDGRWYLVGMDKDKGEIRNFGTERIEGVDITQETFLAPDLTKLKGRYRHVVGLMLKEPEIVRLKFDSFKKHYFKTDPWHPDYEIIEETEDYMIVDLYVGINYELKQKILAYYYGVKVLYPESLAKDIREILRETLRKYEE